MKKTEPWLVFGAAITYWLLCRSGAMELRIMSDSPGYIELSKHSLFSADALRATRTLGYPLLLKFIALWSSGWKAVPPFQYLLLVACSYLFYRGLLGLETGKWRAMGVSIAIFCTSLTYPIVHPSLVLTDAPGMYLAIGTIGAFFLTLRPRCRAWNWVLFVVLLFATYQVRPVYLFLLPLLPFLGALCQSVLFSPSEYNRRRFKVFAAHLAGAFVPFFLFCGLRWVTVSHFGLVSFGGTNTIGISGQLLTDELVPKLPPNLKTLAVGILTKRAQPETLAEAGLKQWESPAYGEYGVYGTALFNHYNYMVWQVAYPVAADLYGGDNVKINRGLTELSREIIKLRPLRYCMWLAKGFGRSVLIVTSAQGFLFSMGSWVFAYLLHMLLRLAGVSLHRLNRLNPLSVRCANLTLLTALTFFTFQTLVTVAVEVPLDRYIVPAMVFIPGVFVALAFLVLDPLSMPVRSFLARFRGGLIDFSCRVFSRAARA